MTVRRKNEKLSSKIQRQIRKHLEFYVKYLYESNSPSLKPKALEKTLLTSLSTSLAFQAEFREIFPINPISANSPRFSPLGMYTGVDRVWGKQTMSLAYIFGFGAHADDLLLFGTGWRSADVDCLWIAEGKGNKWVCI